MKDPMRFPNLYNLKKVKSSKLVFWGAGSVGSQTIAKMCYPWRQVVIADPKNLKEANLERHWLSDRWLGKPKAEGCRSEMIGHNVDPNRVIAHVGPAEEVFDQHTDASAAIVTVDDVDVKYRVNRWCVEHDIPLIIGSVYGQGLGGQVVVIPKPREVCFVCAQAALGNLDYKGHPEGQDYGFDPTLTRDSQGSAQAVPALNAPVGVIADFTALMTTEIVARDTVVDPQVLVIAFHDWVEVRRLTRGEIMKSTSDAIVNQTKLGMLLTMKFGKPEEGVTPLLIRNSTFPIALERWIGCNMHSNKIVVSAKDI